MVVLLLDTESGLGGSILRVELEHLVPVFGCLVVLFGESVIVAELSVSLEEVGLVAVIHGLVTLDNLYELLVVGLGSTGLGLGVELEADVSTLESSVVSKG